MAPGPLAASPFSPRHGPPACPGARWVECARTMSGNNYQQRRGSGAGGTAASTPHGKKKRKKKKGNQAEQPPRRGKSLNDLARRGPRSSRGPFRAQGGGGGVGFWLVEGLCGGWGGGCGGGVFVYGVCGGSRAATPKTPDKMDGERRDRPPCPPLFSAAQMPRRCEAGNCHAALVPFLWGPAVTWRGASWRSDRCRPVRPSSPTLRSSYVTALRAASNEPRTGRPTRNCSRPAPDVSTATRR